MTGTVRSRRDGGVCTLTLDNEGKRNAISHTMMDELVAALAALAEAEEDSVVLLRGARENAFSAGFDLSTGDDPDDDAWDEMTATLAAHDYPTIAVLDGDVFGGGVHLAAACDLRVGRPGTRIGIPAAKLGIVYPPDAIERLVALVGPAKTKELLFTGDPIDAEEAQRIGFTNHLVERSEIDAFSDELAGTIARNAPFAVRSMKRVADAIAETGTLSGEALERAHALRRESYETRDYEEGRAAFAEDREPEFEGR